MKKYKLTDGKEYTVKQISEKVNAPQHIIRSRLTRSNDINKIFAKWESRKNGRKAKNFQMADTGEWVNVWDVVDRVGCSICAARIRLNTHDTADKVFAPKCDQVLERERNLKEDSYKMRQIKKRGMFDNMMALAMRAI